MALAPFFIMDRNHDRRQQLAAPGDLLLNLEDIWQLEPSAQSFSALIGEVAAVEVEERSTAYVLTYAKQRTIGASRLLKATLTLNKSDLHAIEQTLLVQRGNELREYRFVEASFELLPVPAVAPSVFEIEPELNGGAAESWQARELGVPGPHLLAVSPFAQHVGATRSFRRAGSRRRILAQSGEGRP